MGAGPERVPRGEEVAGLQVAAVGGVVGEQLGGGPVELAGVGWRAERAERVEVLAGDVDVEGAGLLVLCVE